MVGFFHVFFIEFSFFLGPSNLALPGCPTVGDVDCSVEFCPWQVCRTIGIASYRRLSARSRTQSGFGVDVEDALELSPGNGGLTGSCGLASVRWSRQPAFRLSRRGFGLDLGLASPSGAGVACADLDPPWLHLFGKFSLEIDRQDAVDEGCPGDLHIRPIRSGARTVAPRYRDADTARHRPRWFRS